MATIIFIFCHETLFQFIAKEQKKNTSQVQLYYSIFLIFYPQLTGFRHRSLCRNLEEVEVELEMELELELELEFQVEVNKQQM